MSLLLEARGLSFGHGRALAQPVDLRLERGARVALVGPNGVGKSSLLAALLDPALRLAGQVMLAPGVRVGHLAQQDRGLAGLPVSGHELLALTGARPEGLPPWLADCLDGRVDRLSGGQQQFLRFWSIAAAPFDVLLLDEPSNNLDVRGVAALTDWLRQPRPRQALLMVTHDERLVAAAPQRRMTLAPRA
jgi:ATPase subunit of ABC transporter with duplicated ATPase domains